MSVINLLKSEKEVIEKMFPKVEKHPLYRNTETAFEVVPATGF